MDGGGTITTASVAICPRCDIPSLVFPGGEALPAAAFGESVDHLPEDVKALYEEARRAVAQRAPNAAALSCRKLLMHVGVEKGAPEGGNFVSYVDYLADNNYVPIDARDWIHEIRELGNDANHEIEPITPEEAKDMVEFTAMMLRVLYEYPERGRQVRAARRERRP